jgi:hypothetical protein
MTIEEVDAIGSLRISSAARLLLKEEQTVQNPVWQGCG